MSQTNTANPPPNDKPMATPQETAQPTAQQTQPPNQNQVVIIERRSWFDQNKGFILQVTKYIQFGIMILIIILACVALIFINRSADNPNLTETQNKIVKVFLYLFIAYKLIGAGIGIIAASMENYILQLIHTIMFILCFPYCLLAIFVTIGFKHKWSNPEPQSPSKV